MANAFSVIRARQGWIDPTDQDFTLKAMMFKQQKYDVNQAKVQSLVDNYQALQLARPVDREYLNERLTHLVNSANTMGPQDLSSNAITSSITNHIGQVLDGNVMTAIQETSKIKSYQESVAKLREKNPELYNPLNEAYGLAPAQDYLNNDQVGAKIQGSLTYTPYQDVQGDQQKYLLELQKSAKNGVIEVPEMVPETDENGAPTGREVASGRMIKTTINGLSANQLQGIAMSYMGTKYDAQININNWGNTGGFKNIEPVIARANQQYESIITEKSKELAHLNSLKTGSITEEQKAVIDNNIKTIESQILDSKQMQSNLAQNPQGALVFLEKQRMAISSGNAIGQLRTVSTEYSKDDYYFSKLDYQLDLQEHQRNLENDAFDREYKTRQLQQNDLKIQMKLNEDGSPSNSSGTPGSDTETGNTGGAGGITFTTEGLSADASPEESAHNLWKTEISDKYQAQNKFGADVMNKINRIASGLEESTPEKVQAAKALVNNFKTQGGKLEPTNGRQVQNFMKEFSRGDAYADLTFLPVDGKTAIQVKSTYDTLFNDWSSSAVKYKSAQKKAVESARKTGGNYGNDLEFVKTAKANSSGVNLNKLANFQVTTKNKGAMQGLIGLSDEVKADGIAYRVAGDSSIQFKNLKNGKYEVSFDSETKDDGVSTLARQKVTVSQEDLYNYIPQLRALNTKVNTHTMERMGTKPLYSPAVSFIPKGSNMYENYKDSLVTMTSNPGVAGRLIDINDARVFAKESLNIQGVRNPELRTQLTELVDRVISNESIKNIKTSVYYDYSTISPSGKGYLGIVGKSGNKIASSSLGVRGDLDEETKLNQYLPQVIYSRVAIEKLSEVVAESIRGNKLTITDDVKKLLNNE